MNLDLKKLQRAAEVSNLVFLFGAGISDPFIPPMPKIEREMDEAEEGQDEKKATALKREFFESVMLPCLQIQSYTPKPGDENPPGSLEKTYDSYKFFLNETTRYLLSRKSTILDKQVNIFTTNIDVFFEKVLEDVGAHYNDGFSGHLLPTFKTGNFQTITKKKGEYLGQQSEIPTYNLYKLHGSVTWRLDPETSQICYSDLSNLREMETLKDKGFAEAYSTLQIINPNRKKFATTTLESTYYDLFRLYSAELEKQNVFLIVVGSSFGDEHILHITRRAMDTNPTLTVCIFAHSKGGLEKYQEKFKGVRYMNNLHIVEPEEDEPEIDLRAVVEAMVSKLNQNGS